MRYSSFHNVMLRNIILHNLCMKFFADDEPLSIFILEKLWLFRMFFFYPVMLLILC